MKFRAKIFQYALFCLLMLSMHSELFAQNPFEIKSRLPDSLKINQIAVENESNPNQLFENPFDVDHTPLTVDSLNVSISVPRIIDREEELNSGEGFVFWLLLFSLLLLVIIMNSNRSLFFRLFRAVLNENMLRLIQREENNGFSGYFIFLFLFFVLNLGLFVYLSLHHFREFSELKIFFFSLIFVLVIYMIRHIAMFFIKSVFPFKKAAATYNFSVLLFNGVMSIFLLPINGLFAFGPEDIKIPLFIAGLVVIGGFYIVRQLRGLFIALGAIDFSIFHFFIYFCTCEIAPIFVILNFLTL